MSFKDLIAEHSYILLYGMLSQHSRLLADLAFHTYSFVRLIQAVLALQLMVELYATSERTGTFPQSAMVACSVASLGLLDTPEGFK